MKLKHRVQRTLLLFPLKWFVLGPGDFWKFVFSGPVLPDVQRDPPRRLVIHKLIFTLKQNSKWLKSYRCTVPQISAYFPCTSFKGNTHRASHLTASATFFGFILNDSRILYCNLIFRLTLIQMVSFWLIFNWLPIEYAFFWNASPRATEQVM